MTETVHMRVGENIGAILLDICQNNISKGNIKKALDTYLVSLHGFTTEHVLMVLKNQAVIVTDEDGEGVSLSDDPDVIKANAHNILDWKFIINKRFEEIAGARENLALNDKEFAKLYNRDIEDYNMLDMVKRFYPDDKDGIMSGNVHIAAQIIGSENSKICAKGCDNPQSKWDQIEEKMSWDPDDDEYPKFKKILYYTVRHVKLIKLIFKLYKEFENTYLFLVKNGFIEKPAYIELFFENTLRTLKDFTDTNKGYYHPLCNEGLYNFKEKMLDELCHTVYGKEYLRNGIIQKDIMDGYDAGWLSPDGEFYGGNGETRNMIHMNIAEQIFKGNGVYANRMDKDGVSEWDGSNSPEYWLEKHGWIKIHDSEIYGSFIGHLGEEPTEDFPYAYCPTDIQIKMICNYADKFCNGKIYTRPQIVRVTDPVSTYKLRQMDKFKLHELFSL